jgi:hypothetical protein
VIMPSGLRRLVLSVHLAVSVGWIGAVGAYMAFDFAAATSEDARTLRTAYLAMDRIAGSVIVPLALATLLTGVVISLGSRWGLFRHYWVVVSLVLTILATVVLVVETGTVGALADAAADPATSGDRLRGLGGTLVHSVGGVAVLLAILVLNVYKPQGLTRYGWRKQRKDNS